MRESGLARYADLVVSLGIYWGWMSLCFFSIALFPVSNDPVFCVELFNLIALFLNTAVTLLVAVLPARIASSLERGRFFLPAVFLVGSVGTAVAVLGCGSFLTVAVGAVVVGIAEGLALYALCGRVAHWARSSEDVVAVFSWALVLAAGLYLAAFCIPDWARSLVCAGLPVLAATFELLAARRSAVEDESLRSGNAVVHSKLSVDRVRDNGDLRKLPWKLLAGLAIFGLAFGLMRISASTQPLGLFEASYVAHVLCRLSTAVAALVLIVRMGKAYWVLSTVQLIAFCIGVCAYWLPLENSGTLTVAATTVGFTCLELLIWVILFELFSETSAPFHSLYGIVRGLVCATILIATFLSAFLMGSIGDGAVRTILVLLLLTMVLVSSLLFGSRNIASLWGLEKPMLAAPEDRSAVLLSALAQEFSLTPRETEVAELLMKGRNEPFIAESLFISPATAHSHVGHIYAKMGVHSRQELLSRVEEIFARIDV
ncbi:MAG: helix-turn-helix transcriptional regulator [Eggerthellales bacterium]|nr:helix-turn-helix transcriptional regulator [Eggerthellales bacterium]